MMRRVIDHCPSCAGALIVTGLSCTNCGTTIGGRFALDSFSRLSVEQSAFLTLFVTRRGNLSEVQSALGISYPTARNKLEEIIKALQAQDDGAALEGTREAILRRVAAGELSAEGALAQLKSSREGNLG